MSETGTYEKDPKSNRVRELTREEAEGGTVTVRVNDMPLLRNFGMSKRQEMREKYGSAIKKEIVVDKETGRYDFVIDKTEKARIDREEYVEARGYEPGAHNATVVGEEEIKGRPVTRTMEVQEISGQEMADALPDRAPEAEAGSELFNE
jgi:hypothetical protein